MLQIAVIGDDILAVHTKHNTDDSASVLPLSFRFSATAIARA